MLKDQIDQDLKAAMLSGDSKKVEVLRGVKSAILYEEVSKGSRETGLNDEQIISVLSKESKKRTESAELYQKGGDMSRSEKELKEKEIIDGYLPAQLTDDELDTLVDKVIKDNSFELPRDMGKVIAQVKSEANGKADGSRVASQVKSKIA